jgi:hypothetical protein
LLLAVIGFLPAKLVQKKTNQKGVVFLLFCSLLFGYFLFESVVAVVFTKGVTVQWLSFIPFLLLFFIPRIKNEKKKPESDLSYLLLPLVLFLFSSWYFLKSYSYDLQSFNKYPFIDIISYACNSLAMGLSGNETSVASGTIYYPELFRFNLYHFTELWAIVGICKILPITETYAICFILPVFFITLIGFGIAALGKNLKIPFYALTAIGLALCFANGKLLLFNDVFLYSFLDLGGLKISLLFPLLILFWLLKDNTPLVLAFGLLLPQTNTLYFLLLATSTGFYVLYNLRNLKNAIPNYIFIGYAIFALSFLFILFTNSEGSESFPIKNFSVLQVIAETFSYFREAVFNLGINYWGVFILGSALVISWKNILLIIPFFVSKTSLKIFCMLWPIDQKLVSIGEVLIFLLVLFFLNWKVKILNKNFFYSFLVLFTLCGFAGIGHTYTGHLDFEQIFTLFACALFPVLVLFLFEEKVKEKSVLDILGIARFKWIVLSFILILVSYKTIRFQRSLPFEKDFYDEISKSIQPDKGQKFSAHFTTKKMYPFPLHVQAGFPLLFEHATALSTTVTLLNDNSWQKTERSAQVKNYPFYIFSTKDSIFQKDKNISQLQNRFIKHFKIKYLWIDPKFDQTQIAIPEIAIQKKIVSKMDGEEFWIISPEML